MAIYSIYRFTNRVNGKVYIGQTVQCPTTRKSDHMRAVESDSTYLIHKAIRKYGLEHFEFEVIFNTFQESDLSEFEMRFILEHDCCVLDGKEKGYNMTRGGSGWDSEFAKQRSRKAVDNGTHPFIGPNFNLKRVAAGEHPLAGEQGSKLQRARVENGTHNLLGERGTKVQQARLNANTHNFQGGRGRALQARRIKDGSHPFVGEHGSKLAKHTQTRLVEQGRHSFQSEKAIEQARVRQLDKVASGTHPWAGNAGSKNNKELAQRLLAEGRHSSQKEYTCPHCGLHGKGNSMLRYHFDKCKHK
jgi:group I intron endonuclease